MKKFVKYTSCILILISLCFIFTACVPRNVDKAVSKMEKNGYQVRIIDEEHLLSGGATVGFRAYKVDEKEGIMAFWFESEDDAKAYLETWIDDSYPIKEMKGLCVYAGTENAVKIFKN